MIFPPFESAPFGPVNFMIKTRRNALLWNEIFSMVHHSQLVLNFFRTRYNEFRSPNIFRASFFYGQLTCISIDIQNFFFIHLCLGKNACTYTHVESDDQKQQNLQQNWSQKTVLSVHCVPQKTTNEGKNFL